MNYKTYYLDLAWPLDGVVACDCQSSSHLTTQSHPSGGPVADLEGGMGAHAPAYLAKINLWLL